MKPINLVLGLAAAVIQISSLAAIEAPSKGVPPENYPVYKLRPGDIISVTVFQEEKLNLKEAAINTDGVLMVSSMPKGLHVAALSVAEAQTLIASEYKKRGIVADPQVTIEIKIFAGGGRRVPYKPNQPPDPTPPNGAGHL